MPIRSCEFDHVTKTHITIGLKIYFQNLVCCMMFFEKDGWTFKIKVRLICLIYFKKTFTSESYLYFESPPSFSKNIMQHMRFWK